MNKLRKRVDKFLGVIQAFGYFVSLDAFLFGDVTIFDAELEQCFEMIRGKRDRHEQHISNALNG